MGEVNQNANSGGFESMGLNSFEFQSEGEGATERAMMKEMGWPETQSADADETQGVDSGESKTSDGSLPKMNWPRMAHKLREYNRRLLKKVFRLEQELAEIDNKFNKYVEKSRNSDLLLAQQAKEIQQYQEKLALLTQKLSSSQQQLDSQTQVIQQISQQQELSQQQAAQLERECTLLQEKYNHQSFELVAKEQESRELQAQMEQQQQQLLQQEAELKHHQEAELARKERTAQRHKNYPHNRFVQPWSASVLPEPKIAVSKTRSRTSVAKTPKLEPKKSDAIKTAAEIATWSAAQKAKQQQLTSGNAPVKPQSLAAVDLPTFPRP